MCWSKLRKIENNRKLLKATILERSCTIGLFQTQGQPGVRGGGGAPWEELVLNGKMERFEGICRSNKMHE